MPKRQELEITRFPKSRPAFLTHEDGGGRVRASHRRRLLTGAERARGVEEVQEGGVVT